MLTILISISLAMPQTAGQGETPPRPTTAPPTVGRTAEQDDKSAVVYYLPFGQDPYIGVSPESIVTDYPSRRIRVGRDGLKSILRYVGQTLPHCKDDSLKYSRLGTCLSIQFADGDRIVVDSQGVVLHGKSLSRMTPSAFLRLDQMLEQMAYEQGKGLRFMPPRTGRRQEP